MHQLHGVLPHVSVTGRLWQSLGGYHDYKLAQIVNTPRLSLLSIQTFNFSNYNSLWSSQNFSARIQGSGDLFSCPPTTVIQTSLGSYHQIKTFTQLQCYFSIY